MFQQSKFGATMDTIKDELIKNTEKAISDAEKDAKKAKDDSDKAVKEQKKAQDDYDEAKKKLDDAKDDAKKADETYKKASSKDKSKAEKDKKKADKAKDDAQEKYDKAKKKLDTAKADAKTKATLATTKQQAVNTLKKELEKAKTKITTTTTSSTGTDSSSVPPPTPSPPTGPQADLLKLYTPYGNINTISITNKSLNTITIAFDIIQGSKSSTINSGNTEIFPNLNIKSSSDGSVAILTITDGTNKVKLRFVDLQPDQNFIIYNGNGNWTVSKDDNVSPMFTKQMAPVSAPVEAPVEAPVSAPEPEPVVEKKSNTMKYIIIGIVVVVLLLGGFFGFKFFKGRKATSSAPVDKIVETIAGAFGKKRRR